MNEYEQQQPPIMMMPDNQPYTTVQQDTRGVVNMESSEQLKILLTHREILERVDDFLKGKYYDYSSDKWSDKSFPKMNEQGIAEIMRIFELRISKIFSLSNLNDMEISKIMKYFTRELVIHLNCNYEQFNLKLEDIYPIEHEISDCVYVVLKMSKDGNFQKFLKDNMKMIETRNFGKPQKDVGGLMK